MTTPGVAVEGPESLAAMTDALVKVVMDLGHLKLAQPIMLSSGDLSQDFIDAKRALAHGTDLRLAGNALLALAAEEGWEFEAVGGLTLGADHFSHAIAMLGDKSWFVVRKAQKDHGTKKRIEGTDVAGKRVLLVDDVVTRGESVRDAYDQVVAAGGIVAGVTALVDRGPATARLFRLIGVPYRSLLTYRDLGIDPVGDGKAATQGA